jgi:ectoine hydroxylase-related dioxygenase (phytanoyl-CoA dioxygenase family)
LPGADPIEIRKSMITDRDVEFYGDQGYLVVENVIDADTARAMKRIIEELLEKARGVADHTEVYDLEPTHTPENPRVRRIKKPHVVHPLFWEFAKSPKLISVLSRLLGPDIRLHGSKLNIKAPMYGSPVEWHQDWAFYPHTNDSLLAVGVMLEDVGLDNGPMLVLPRTHTGPTYNHHQDGVFCGAIDLESCPLDFGKAVPVYGKAGSASFHHVRLVHGSAQNTSTRARPLLLYEYATADAWPLLGVSTLDEFNSRMVSGTATIEPRLSPAPARMPLPPARNQGSIYENQTALKRRYFGAAEEEQAESLVK